MKPKKDDQEPLLNVGDVNLAPRETVSATLRRHRKQTGQELKAVAEALRIRYVYLEAIEQGRYDALPGPTYALGFIKTYAEYLNLDEDEIVQQFREDVDGLDDQTQLVFPSPVPEGKVPGGAILLVALLMGSMAYGGWHYLSNRDSGFADFIPALPDRLQALFDGDTVSSPDSELAGTQEPTTSTSLTAVSDAVASTETVPPADSNTDASDSETPSVVQAEREAAQETVAATAASVAEETPASTPESAIAQSASEENVASSQAVAAVSEAASPVAPAPQQATTQSSEPTSSDLSQDAVTVATLAAPSSPDRTTSTSASGGAGGETTQGTTVISSQTVTNQVAVASQVSSSEIPAAPAAPVTTQTVSVPDATQPQVYGEDNADARIILRATQDAWVQVRDSANELLLTRVLREGDVYRVPNQEGLTLLTGNAGGIDVLVDGTLLAPLGPVGSVRRDLALDPQVLLAGTASQ